MNLADPLVLKNMSTVTLLTKAVELPHFKHQYLQFHGYIKVIQKS
jgi:hypothetical protein